MTRQMLRFTTFLATVLVSLGLWAQPDDYTWTTPSRNSSESMPCGGGDIGMNVWVENGELLFYLSRSGTFDEHNTLLKQGRVRVRLDDPSLLDSDFRQTLKLNDGYVEVLLRGVTVQLWADVHRPVVHLELSGKRPFTYTLTYENWRYADRPLRKGEGQQCSYKWAIPKKAVTTHDVMEPADDGVLFYHSSCREPGIVGLAEVASESYPDRTQFDPSNPYFDPKSSKEAPRWFAVDVRVVAPCGLISIQTLRSDPELARLIILKRGNRLSVTPVAPEDFERIRTQHMHF